MNRIDGTTTTPAETASGDRQKRIAERLAHLADRPDDSIPTRPAGEPVPLTPMQQQIWFASWLDPDVPLYSITIRKRLRGPLDVAVLRKSIETVVRRQEALRSTVCSTPEGPVQIVQPFTGMNIPLEDVGHLPAGAREQRALELAEDMSTYVPDLESEWPIRAMLIRLDDMDHVLLVTIHHIVSDGRSRQIFLSELAACYESFAAGTEPDLPAVPVSFADYARWNHDRLENLPPGTRLDFWREKLAGATALDLPADGTRRSGPDYDGDRLDFDIPDELSARLRELGRSEGATYFITLLSGFYVLLRDLSGQDDLTVGCPVSGRSRKELEPLVGCFINTLPYRVDLSGGPSFREVIRRTRKTAFEAFSHQDFSLPNLLADLKTPRIPGVHPIYQVIFQLANFEKADLSGMSLEWEEFDTESSLSLLDLAFALSDDDGQTTGYVVYRNALFTERSVRRMTNRFVRLLEEMVDRPDASLPNIEPVEPAAGYPAELESVTRKDTTDCCIHELVERQAAARPDAVAVSHAGTDVTYDELNRRANRIARHLRDSGVRPEALVAVCMDRSPDLIAAILGILKAGGAYVPMDPASPEARLAHVLQDADPVVLVTDEANTHRFPGFTGHLVSIDGDLTEIDGHARTNPEGGATPNNLAYVIYTSGSTGKPKGVMVEHRSLAKFIETFHAGLGTTHRDRYLQLVSIGFDVAVNEILGTLCCGATIVLRPEDMLDHPARYLELCDALDVTISHLPAAYWHELVPTMQRDALSLPASLRCLLVGAEKLRPDIWALWQTLVGDRVTLRNEYGPTEATIGAVVCDLTRLQADPDREVPIGRTLGHLESHVLDAEGRPVPQGRAGELYLGGVGLARGYLNRPDLTAEMFIPSPFSDDPANRLYRTGDHVYYREDGLLSFVGRVDRQTKIRGHRVEPEEIEAAIRTCPGVEDGYVNVSRDAVGHARLDAYVIPRPGGPEPEFVREYLRQTLPGYMVPGSVTYLDSFPKTPNGKVDATALPSPGVPSDETVSHGDRRDAGRSGLTKTEAMLADIWTSLLDVPEVRRTDNFFDIGGHSLLAIRIVTETKRRTGVEIALRVIFDSPTLGELARAIDLASAGMRPAIDSNGRAAAGADAAPVPTHSNGAAHGDGPPPHDGEETFRKGTPLSQRERVLPVSFAQRRLWFIDRLEESSSAYTIPMFYRVRGSLDVGALEGALGDVVARHEILRTRFRLDGARPVQVILPELQVSIPVLDLESLPPTARQNRIDRAMADELYRPFDLSEDPLIRASLLRISPTEHVLLLNLHHIVIDEWSFHILFRELNAFYIERTEGVGASLTDLPLQYADFAVRQHEQMAAGDFEGQLSFWRNRLEGHTPVDLPVDRRRAGRPGFSGSQHDFPLPDPILGRGRILGRDERSSMFMVVLTALYVLVHRYTDADDIAIGGHSAGRTRTELSGLIGFFVNTLVLRADTSGRPSFRELLRQVREIVLDAESNQDLPYDVLVEELKPDREGGRPKLFQVAFSYGRADDGGPDLPGLHFDRIKPDRNSTKFDIGLSMMEEDDELKGSIRYDTDLFEHATIRRMSEDLIAVLGTALEDPDAGIDDIPLVHDSEVLRRAASPQPVPPPSVRVHDEIARHARVRPDATSVSHGDRFVTFRELDEESNRVAHLLREFGVGRDCLVGVSLDRSPELIIGLLAVLKAGGAYVPMDPVYPDARLMYMLEDADPVVLITEDRHRDRFEGFQGRILSMDGDRARIGTRDASAPDVSVEPGDLAYVIYTSGSTGAPKGVMIEHRSLEHLVAASIHDLNLTPDDRELQFASISFDVAVQEIFETLVAGATLVLRTDEMLDHPARFLDACSERELTVLHLPTAYWHELVKAMVSEDLAMPDTVRLVEIGGERVRSDMWKSWQEHVGSGVRLINGYGPTEATVTATVCELTHIEADTRREVPIGLPYAHCRIHVRDSRGNPVPVGVPGELMLGGSGIARGYLNRPELTAERFIPDPHADRSGALLYRTGDLVRFRNDAQLEFIGRIDRQVKIRGYRIEPGEIEAVLNEFDGVTDAVVEVRTDDEGGGRLDAYIVFDGGRDSVEGVRDRLRQVMPGYMVPATFTVLESLPRTANEKIDRAALPAPDTALHDAVGDHEAPLSGTEEVLTEIWMSLLGAERIGRRDNFFDMGGHSLLAIQIVTETRRRLGADIALRTIFDAPTIAELASEVDRLIETRPVAPKARAVEPRIEAIPSGGTSPAAAAVKEAPPRTGASTPTPPIRSVNREGALPLSSAQKRLWFIEQLDNVGSTYNIPAVVRLNGPLDIDALDRSLQDVVRRHEVLRTTFQLEDDRPVQVVERRPRVPVEVRDLTDIADSEREKELRMIVDDEVDRPFDLARGPLIRSTVVRSALDEHVVILNLHHIVTDEWSMRVLFGELEALYAAHVDGGWPSLPALEVQYGDYAVWQNEQLENGRLEHEFDYWRNRLDRLAVAELPMDRARPANPSFRGAGHRFRLEEAVVDRVRAIGGETRATTFMVLLGALKVLIHRYTESTDITVGSPFSGRNHDQLADLIGFFVNTVVLRTDAGGDPSFREMLKRTRDTVLGAAAHQNLPFEKLVEELRPDRDLGLSHLFQVMFSYSKAGKDRFELPGLSSREMPLDHHTAKFDLGVFAVESGNEVSGSFWFDTDLFDSESIRLMTETFTVLVKSATLHPDVPISKLPLVTDEHRERLLEVSAGRRTDYPRETPIHVLFEEHARATPEAPAIVSDEAVVTYGGLSAETDRLAAGILRRAGGPVSRVGICMDRSPGAVKAMLAVLKAGATYVPLDPSYPAARLQFMIADAGLDVLLASDSLPDNVEIPPGVSVLDPAALGESHDSDVERSTSLPTDPAYIIYTSGSTGTPKGVIVPHRAVVRLVMNTDYVELGPDDRIGHASNISFDAATFEVWGALLNGSALIVMDRETILSPTRLAASIRAQRINTLFLTTALMNTVAQTAPDAFSTLRYLLFGGETASPDHVRKILNLGPPDNLLHVYGPTENTTFSTWHRVEHVDKGAVSIPIGRPIANSSVFVLDGRLNPVPPGTPGELFLGGDGLAHGYLDRPELTGERFIGNPDLPGSEPGLYRTGDVVRWTSDFDLEFIGRTDRQVKIRGFRIELGEVESALRSHPNVSDCTVVAEDSDAVGKHLVAYLVPGRNSPADTPGVMDHLRSRLPGYMLPGSVAWLDRLPLTPNGKIDRQALAETARALTNEADLKAAPADETRKRLHELWCTLLDRDDVGIREDFFQAGGHSLLAVELFFKIERIFGRKLSVSTIFAAPTIEQLAVVLERPEPRPSRFSSLVPIRSEGTGTPLFCTHGVASDVLQFKPLSDLLTPGRPVYGLQGEGLDGRAFKLDSVEDMASTYADEIEAASPSGPIYLTGFCYGGLIALEAARQLQQRGREIGLLVLVDTVSPARQSDGPPESKLKRYTAGVQDAASTGLTFLAKRVMGHLAYRLGQGRRRVGRLVARTCLAIGRPVPRSIRLQHIVHSNQRIIEKYRIERYGGVITLIPSTEGMRGSDDYGWADIADGGVEIFTVEGSHHLLREPHVGKLADCMQTILDRADERS